MARKNVIELLVTAVTSGGWFEITIPDGIGGYLSRKITFAGLKDAINLENTYNKGYYEDEAALIAAFPVGETGWYAINGDTDTVWLWDATTVAWVDSGQSGAVVSVNGMTGTVSLTATDISFSSLQGLSATNVRDAIDELKVYVDSVISGAGGIYVTEHRNGEESTTAGANTITFEDEGGSPYPMADTDYVLLIDDISGCGVDKVNVVKTVNGFSVDCLEAGTISYLAIRAADSGTAVEDTDAIHVNESGEISAITQKNTPISTDMLVIEDSEDSDAKKMIEIGDLPATGTGSISTQTETLTDGGSGNIVVGDITAQRALFIYYSITRGTLVETGEFVLTNKSDSYINRRSTSSDNAGITFGKSISGNNIRLDWNDTLADGNDCSLKMSLILQTV